MATWTWFHRLASPPHVYAFARRWTPWFGGFAAVAMLRRAVRRAGARARGLPAEGRVPHGVRARADARGCRS